VAPTPYIRTTDPDDGGARPITPGVNYYATPAIYIRNPSTGAEGATAIADVDQLVIVEVSNSGTIADAETLAVQVWACGFGTNGNDFAATLGGQLGAQTTNANPIPAGAAGPTAVEVPIPWRPQAAEVGGSERHFCIRANVYGLNNAAADKVLDGNLINVPAQARHAQRNMTLLKVAPMIKKFSFDLLTANPDFERGQLFDLEIAEITGRFEPTELVALERSNLVERVDERGLALRGTRGEIAVTPSDRPAERLQIELGKQRGSGIAVEYEPGQERWVTMTLRFDEEPGGTVHRFDVVQRGPDGLIGGARVMTIVVPDDLDSDDDDKSGY
jgi:hypothetical protein